MNLNFLSPTDKKFAAVLAADTLIAAQLMVAQLSHHPWVDTSRSTNLITKS